MDHPSIALLRNTFRYEPETGRLFWRDRDRNLSGLEAGSVDARMGYRRVRVDRHLYLAHRVILAMVYGEWPPEEVDHINGNRSDNRLANLRAVSRAENFRNKSKYASNTSGATGVCWHRQHRKWCASISVDGRRRTIGVFAAKDEAIAARRAAEVEHGYHVNHGRQKA